MKLMKFKILILFFVFTFLLSAKVTYACRTVRPSTTAMVENAEVIVRVEAIEYVEEPKGDIRDLNEPSNATINFKVKETLKGDAVQYLCQIRQMKQKIYADECFLFG